MKTYLAMTIAISSILVASGCATKKYVQQTTAPIQAKVDQVGEQATRQGTMIEETNKEVKAVDQRAEAGISAAKERAMSAEGKATEAMTKATEAGTLAADAKTMGDRNSRELGMLRGVVSNIDDYKLAAETAVNFKFGQYKLTDESKAALDKLVTDKGNAKRYVISVEGYTDKVGSVEYNNVLSRQRANSVMSYLVSKHNIPVYRVHMIGLGEEKPVDEGRTREARSKNRRVEVKIFSADPNLSAMSSSTATAQ